jgi:hypothetical protein
LHSPTIADEQEQHKDLTGLPDKACFQMNDTHPTIAGVSAVPLLLLLLRSLCVMSRLQSLLSHLHPLLICLPSCSPS